MFGWLRPKPGDIAQHVIALMEDPARWQARLMSVRRTDLDLMVHVDWATAVSVGGVRMRFDGWDGWRVQRAYHRLRKRIAAQRQLQAAQRIREGLAIPPAAPALRTPTLAPEPESLEAVEARVRLLREAILHASASDAASAGPAR